MPFGFEGRTAPCTRCPVPCSKCRQKPQGPYCNETPCPCRCHRSITKGMDARLHASAQAVIAADRDEDKPPVIVERAPTTLVELLDEKLAARAVDHVQYGNSLTCMPRRKRFCIACVPAGTTADDDATRTQNYMAAEREEIVSILLRLMDEGFVTRDELRDHSDD